MKDLGDEKTVQEALEKHAVKEFLSKEDLKRLLVQKSFRKFLWTMLSECGIYNMPYMGEVNDCMIRLGKQDIGRRLIQRLEQVDTGAYPNLLLEFRKEENV